MALKKHHFTPRPSPEPDTPPTEPASAPEVVVSPPVVVAPVFVADAGQRLFVDRAGKAIGNGLTEGADNFHTITEHARSVLPSE